MERLDKVMQKIKAHSDSEFRRGDCPECKTKGSLKSLWKDGEMINSQCNVCDEKKLGKEIEERNEELRKKKMKDDLQNFFSYHSMVNEELKDADFQNYEPQTEKQKIAFYETSKYAMDFSKDNPHNLLLVGPYGTGKSHLAVSCAKTVMNAGYTAVFVRTEKMLSKIKSTYNKGSDTTEEELINMLTNVDLLILDDLGSESRSENKDQEKDTWATGKLCDILEDRQGKHTIFTTNYGSTALKERLNIRVFERVINKTKPIIFDGESMRIKRFTEGW